MTGGDHSGSERDRRLADGGARDAPVEVPPVADLLDELGFEAADSVLTRRQAEVLALREWGLSQSAVADRLDTSRANVSGVEASARENVRKAREAVAFADALSAPVRVTVEPGTELYDVPDRVFGAADEAGLKVDYSAPGLMAAVSEAAGDAVRRRTVRAPLTVGVTETGDVEVRVDRSGDPDPDADRDRT